MNDVIVPLYINQVDTAASQDAIRDSRILSPEMEILADVAAAPLKIQVVSPLREWIFVVCICMFTDIHQMQTHRALDFVLVMTSCVAVHISGAPGAQSCQGAAFSAAERGAKIAAHFSKTVSR
jgi:hypothetical protein